MPNCKKCSKIFNRYVFEKGIKKNLGSSRNLCLECSPYRKRYISKKKLDINKLTIICSRCNQEYNKIGAANSKLCASCVVNSRRTKKKAILVDYKGGCCSICGYKKCINALVFHHIQKSTKSFSISGNHSLSLIRLKSEVDKCILLCSNCHIEVHNSISYISAS